jgi:hypothetical protein
LEREVRSFSFFPFFKLFSNSNLFNSNSFKTFHKIL